MADDTVAAQAAPETVPSGDSKTTVQPNAPQQSNAIDPAEVERLRKEAMRVKQLENELAARKQAEADAQAKQLEENQQFKDLWEKERLEKETLLREREDAQRKAELEAATNGLLRNYSPAVQELAATAGLSLTDDSESAQADLKAKLDTFASKIGSPKVEANNPGPSPEPQTNRDQQIKVMRMNNVPTSVRTQATREAIGSLEAVKAMKTANGITE